VFDRLHSGDGLSHNSVYAIHQDREGFMWFGTLDGLNRYDGYEFVIYRHDPTDSTSLSHNLVRTIFEDADGTLWIGTQDGISRKGFGAEHFVRYAVPDSTGSSARNVYAFARDMGGTLWAATDAGLLRYRPDSDQFETVLFSQGGAAVDLVSRPDGLRVLVTYGQAGGGTVYRIDPQSQQVVHKWELSTDWGSVFRFALDDQDNYWFKHPGPVIRRGDRLVPSGNGDADNALAVRALKGGQILLGTSGAGYYACTSRGACTQHLIDDIQATWLHNFPRSIYEDASGGIWMGTYGGVYHANPHRKPFAVHRHDPAALGNDAVSAMARTSEGTLWVSTFGGGLSTLDASSGRLRRVSAAQIPEDVIWDIRSDEKGHLWIGAKDRLIQYNPDTRRFVPHPAVSTSSGQATITAIREHGGQLWIGTFSGLMTYDPDTRIASWVGMGAAGRESTEAVNALSVDGDVLWIGLVGGDVGRLELATKRFVRIAPRNASGERQASETIYDLQPGAEGSLWVASGAGLFRYDHSAETFDHYTTQRGLPGSVVYSVQADGSGHLWLGTNRGLSRFNPDTGAIRTYDLRDGIGMMEFNRHARFRDTDGTLFLGGGDGLLGFQPESIHDASGAPPVALISIESASRDGVKTYNPRGLNRLRLEPGETTATFSFSALGFFVSERQRYRYQLEGFDEEWVEAGTQRQARYTNLAPGAYTFRVLASNADGVWNETGLSLPVTVKPAYWQTLWFRMLLVLAVLMALAAIYRARVQRLLGLERLRLRIASDLHDDLAGDLSGIAFAADLVRQRAGAGVDRDRLGEIRDTASGMVDALRDIVWTINPEHDTMEALVRRMRTVARQLLASHDHSFEADLPEETHAVPMPIRHDLLLLYKEALHNIVRHANAMRVDVLIARVDGRLVLTISDDGQGFDLDSTGDGHGLRSMRHRAETMGGTLAVETAPGQGTQLQVHVPMTRTRGRRTGTSGVS